MLASRLAAADEHPDLRRLAGEIDGRLAGGIAAADQRDLLAVARAFASSGEAQ